MDASNVGSGTSLLQDSLSGPKNIQERFLHINILEFRAICLGLPTSLCRGVEGLFCCYFFRQHHSTCISQQGRKYPFYTTQQGGMIDSRLGRDSFRANSDPVCKGIRQRGSRLSELTASGSLHRVDTAHGHVPPVVAGMGLPDSGSLCHSPELQDPELCVSISGSQSNCHRS